MKKLWDLKNHGSDTPTSARAILHYTDQKGPNILTWSVLDMDFLIYIRQSLIHFEVWNDAFCWHISAMTEIKYDPFFVCVSQMTHKAFY